MDTVTETYILGERETPGDFKIVRDSVCVCMCVCERVRESERERERKLKINYQGNDIAEESML